MERLRLIAMTSCLVLTAYWAGAQQTGVVDYPTLGIRFTIPDGWKGAESGEVFLMGSDTQPGLIILMTHQESQIQNLKTQAEAGLVDEGISLQKAGDFEKVGSEGIGAEFSGNIQGTQAKAYIAAVVNPFGTGVTVVAATDVPNYSSLYKQLAKEVAGSLQFSQPKEPPVTEEWRQTLQGAKLTYLDSYSSSGFDSYGGYSDHEEILLCGTRFTFYKNSRMSIDTGGAYASSLDKSNNAGNWTVTTNASGVPLLHLQYDNGDVSDFELEYKETKTYLNGYRYFRTYDHGECR
ncbi:MAG: hypothetical protein RIB71_15725 [Imperialibacter sp.]|uniref:hypothetical protein n=1 Tax=Imperialibacter sp. TaxID=2038411 RepID=UPI0032ED4780